MNLMANGYIQLTYLTQTNALDRCFLLKMSKKKLIKHNTFKKVKANTTFIKGVDNSPTPLLAFIVEI